jgi:hypothetical protein
VEGFQSGLDLKGGLAGVAIAAPLKGLFIKPDEIGGANGTGVERGGPLAGGLFRQDGDEIRVRVAIGQAAGDPGLVEEVLEAGDEGIDGGGQAVADAGNFRGGGELSITDASLGILCVVADDQGQHEADGFAVHDIEMGGEWVGGGVGGAEHAIFDGGTGVGGGEEHVPAGFEVRGLLEDGGQGGDDAFEGLMREHEGERIPFGGDGGFHGVSEGIDTGMGGDGVRLGEGESGVEDGDARGGLGIEAGHFLMSLIVGNEGGALAFAAGAGGGGDGDEGQHGL